MPDCLVCNSSTFTELVAAAEITRECQLREAFVAERLQRPASDAERKDLTDFFHQAGASIWQCDCCTLLTRRECEKRPAETYTEEAYDPEVILRQYPAYVQAFVEREATFRPLLPPGSQVLEIGSHYGAFLEVAGQWGWRAEGVDVGVDTTRFARSRGHTIHFGEIGAFNFRPASQDGIFIWNCFEQIEDPKPLLTEARRLLRKGGLLVVRVPNGLFYTTARRLLAHGGMAGDSRVLLEDALGYNNLFGFPYQYGHRLETLRQLIEPFGFDWQGSANSELLTFPLPDKPRAIQKEERAVNREMKLLARSVLSDGLGTLLGPWIEVWFRARE